MLLLTIVVAFLFIIRLWDILFVFKLTASILINFFKPGLAKFAMILKALFVIFSVAVPFCMATAVPPCNITPLTIADITAIAPESATCTGAPYPAECATASDATPWINLAFHTFSIHAFGTQAALLSLMLYESGSFRYNINHYPGVPGQGTRNMQSSAFNLKYAQWLAVNMTYSGISLQQVAEADKEGSVQVLALVKGERWSFASAAWFLATQCNEEISRGLAALTEEGWDTYLTDCVGTTVTDDRTAIWKKAIALGK